MKKIKKIIIISILTASFILVFISVLKPVFAQAPPPASRIWLWLMLGEQASSRKVRVEVTWQELGQPKKVEMKAILKDIK